MKNIGIRLSIIFTLLGSIFLFLATISSSAFADRSNEDQEEQEELTNSATGHLIGFTWDSYLNISYSNPAGTTLQKLDIYTPKWTKANDKKPIIFFVHGWWWRNWDKGNLLYKPQAFTQKGYIFVSINYTLYDDSSNTNKHPAQIEDVAKAFSYIYTNINKYGWDANEIYTMGHSAWGHLVALLSTDEQYLQKYSLPLSSIKWTISLDAGWLDIHQCIELRNNSSRVQSMYVPVFWDSVEEQNDASPMFHLESWKGIPPFLFFTAGNEKRASQILALQMGSTLQSIGVYNELDNYPKLSHEEINKTLWAPWDKKIIQIFDFINKIGGESLPTSPTGSWEWVHTIKVKWFDVLYMNVEKELLSNMKNTPVSTVAFDINTVNSTKNNILILKNQKNWKVICLFFSQDKLLIMQWSKKDWKKIMDF